MKDAWNKADQPCLVITGGCGFIGSAVTRHLLKNTNYNIVCIDKMTYAACLDALELDEKTKQRHHLVKADICDQPTMDQILELYKPDRIMHLAAESHVDRSIDGPKPFIETNILGTFSLLQAAIRYWDSLKEREQNRFLFHHISTDEVFGALDDEDPPFNETTPYDPRSPYSASKAASDHLVRAWYHTYGLPTLVSNTTNNYGPWQFPEKLIPLITIKAIKGLELPVYGDGKNTRDWLYVDDHAEALVQLVQNGVAGQTYCIGASQPRKNIEVVETIVKILDRILPDNKGSRDRLIRFVQDRPGHDHRYEIDPIQAQQSLGWRAKHSFEEGIEKTITWYLENQEWWKEIEKTKYRGIRIGQKIKEMEN